MAFPADFTAGKKAFDIGDYATAATEWKAAANDGDPAAQYWLRWLYENGRGVDKDEVFARRLQLLSAEGGYEYAQNALGWPIRAENRPYLTCSPYPPHTPRPAGDETPVQAGSMKGCQFQVTFHNARPPIERLIISASNMSEKPKSPNVQIAVYRMENGVRKEVPHEITSWGGGGGGGAGIADAVLLLGLRIPVEELERRLYVEQFLARLPVTPGQTPEKMQQARQMMLHSDRPNEPSYLDNLIPTDRGFTKSYAGISRRIQASGRIPSKHRHCALSTSRR